VSYSWTADAALCRRREGAVSDVLDGGLSELAAAARWSVRVDEVRHWVADTRADDQTES
jgi:hypothetical protein